MGNGYYILDGHEPKEVKDVIEWAGSFEKMTRQVERTQIGDVLVSTVFLGLDHNFTDGVPILFETLVFGGDLDGEMERYSTWDEAVKGHHFMCEKVIG